MTSVKWEELEIICFGLIVIYSWVYLKVQQVIVLPPFPPADHLNPLDGFIVVIVLALLNFVLQYIGRLII